MTVYRLRDSYDQVLEVEVQDNEYLVEAIVKAGMFDCVSASVGYTGFPNWYASIPSDKLQHDLKVAQSYFEMAS